MQIYSKMKQVVNLKELTGFVFWLLFCSMLALDYSELSKPYISTIREPNKLLYVKEMQDIIALHLALGFKCLLMLTVPEAACWSTETPSSSFLSLKNKTKTKKSGKTGIVWFFLHCCKNCSCMAAVLMA